jgi:hypothetical protein
MTTAEKLAAVNRAISAILDGAQEYQINGRRIRRGELSTLLNERRYLEAQLASESGNDVTVGHLGRR